MASTQADRSTDIRAVQLVVDVTERAPITLGPAVGGTGGLTCPECRGARQLPSLRIEGTVLDDLLLEAVNVGNLSDAVLRGRVSEVTDVAGVPFELEVGGGMGHWKQRTRRRGGAWSVSSAAAREELDRWS